MGKFEKLVTFVSNLWDNRLAVGSRTPIAHTPAWATLEVATGGFATGNLLAGGDLLPHEYALARRFHLRKATRLALNRFYFSDAGQAHLLDRLHDGLYRVEVPEEAALLAVAYLLQHGGEDAALAVVREIAPWMERLRFYPIPLTVEDLGGEPEAEVTAEFGNVSVDPEGASGERSGKEEREATSGGASGEDVLAGEAEGLAVDMEGEARAARVFRFPACHVRTQLKEIADRPPPASIVAQREQAQSLMPLYDTLVTLFLQTLDEPERPPTFGADGKVEGAWPCQVYPADWTEKMQAVIDAAARLQCTHSHHKAFAWLLFAGTRVVKRGGEALTGKDVGFVRFYLAGILAKRGPPGSDTARAHRERQLASLRQKPEKQRAALASVLLRRLTSLPAHEGIAEPGRFLGPIKEEEVEAASAAECGLVGVKVPAPLASVVEQAHWAPLDVLLQLNRVPSAEELAKLLPLVSLQTVSSDDPALQRLYERVYVAFRRRRSLLLLNYEKQVQFGELPWVAAVMPSMRVRDGGAARAHLQRVAKLVLLHFPATLVPNKLVQELVVLFKNAGMEDVPLTEELAVDIFMGHFTKKFTRAAHNALGYLEGTVYQRYYGLQNAATARHMDISKLAEGVEGLPEQGGCYSVVRNGMLIERSMIVNSHNLVQLLQVAQLSREELQGLVKTTLKQVAKLVERAGDASLAYKLRLASVKDAAYAWRHVVTFMAALEKAGGGLPAAASAEENAEITELIASGGVKMKKLVVGLKSAMKGRRTWDILFGWTPTKHWLME